MARAASVSGNCISGIFVLDTVTPADGAPADLHVSHGALPRYVHLADGDQVLGNLSTNAHKDQPALVDPKAVNLYFTIMPEKVVKEDAIPFLRGPPFKGGDFPCLASLNLNRSWKYVIMAVPVSFFTPWGIGGVITGLVDSDVIALFENMHPVAGAAWLQVAHHHSASMGALITDNISALAAVLPDLPANTFPIADPYCRFESISPENQEGIHSAICVQHSERLQSFHISPAPVSSVGGGLQFDQTPGDASTLGGGEPGSSPTQERKGPPEEVQRRLATWTLILGTAGPDPATGELVFLPPILNDEAITALSFPKKPMALGALHSHFEDTQTTHCQSRDHHVRMCSFDALCDKVQLSWLLHGKGASSSEKYKSMEDLKAVRSGLTALSLLPDTKGFAAQRRQAHAALDTRANEEFIGEETEKLSKLSTQVILVSSIGTIRSLQVLLSNCTLIACTIAKLDPTTNPPGAPYLHSMGFQFAEILHDKTFGDWFEDCTERSRSVFLYWLFARINTILHMILQFGTVEKHLQVVTSADGISGARKSVDPSKHASVNDAITQVVNAIVKVVDGTSPAVPEVSLFTTSPCCASYEAKKNQSIINQYLSKEKRQVVTPGGEAYKRARVNTPYSPPQLKSPHDLVNPLPAPATARTVGEIVWDRTKAKGGTFRVPLPPHLDGVQSLCLVHVLSGNRGCLSGASCSFAHPSCFEHWHPKIINLWDGHIKRTEGLSWNHTMTKR